MASETGHARDVANFESLISDVQSFGAGYNPPRANLKLPALTTLADAARDSVSEVSFYANAHSVAAK